MQSLVYFADETDKACVPITSIDVQTMTANGYPGMRQLPYICFSASPVARF